jgi:glycosyltransferase involved in cell wall biosynthesis
MEILTIYQFCTLGGIERVLLNRAMAFRKFNIDVKITAVFLKDYNAAESFQAYIGGHDLDDYLECRIVREIDDISLTRFELIMSIDTPQVHDKISSHPSFIIECHTAYDANRRYLQDIPEQVRAILVPSETFAKKVMSECPHIKDKIKVCSNYVPDTFFNLPPSEGELLFGKQPLVFMSRLDNLKNFEEVAEVFTLLEKTGSFIFFIIGRPADRTGFITSLHKKGILGSCVLHDAIPFGQIPGFMRMLKRHRGIFMSASTAESFGLAVAESFSAGIPVMVSDIPEHRYLVQDREEYLYPLGDVRAAADKIMRIGTGWDSFSRWNMEHSAHLRDVAFINDWKELMASL